MRSLSDGRLGSKGLRKLRGGETGVPWTQGKLRGGETGVPWTQGKLRGGETGVPGSGLGALLIDGPEVNP